MPQIPLLTPQGKDAHAELTVTRAAGSTCQITIGWEFAGRDVDEELDLSELQRIGGEEPYACFELIGLSFETDGTQIKGMIGAGSGNVVFLIKREDWLAALDELASAP